MHCKIKKVNAKAKYLKEGQILAETETWNTEKIGAFEQPKTQEKMQKAQEMQNVFWLILEA